MSSVVIAIQYYSDGIEINEYTNIKARYKNSNIIKDIKMFIEK